MASAPDHYDLISLGSGEAGKYIAWGLSSKNGKKCAVVERQYIGGSCPNTACLPSKNFIHSANVAHSMREAQKYGLGAYVSNVEDFRVDMNGVKATKVKMVDGLIEMHQGRFDATKAELIMGEGRLIGPKTIKVDTGRVLTADTIIICTGSKARIDTDIPGLVEANPLTHIEILNLNTLPSHLIILGGGYVGLEFAQAFRRFGSDVTVIEHNGQVLKNEDKDAVNVLTEVLSREGVNFLTSTRVTTVKGTSGKAVSLDIEQRSPYGTVQSVIEGSHILAAAGRTPNTANIGLEEAGIKLTDKGHVAVDEQLRTSVDGVFAVGDCAGSPHFTHIAYDDYRLVYSYLTDTPRPGGTTTRQVPSVLFTSPELAHVGLREHEALSQGIKYRLAKLPMLGFLRTRTLGETDGFAKALIESSSDKVLGFTAVGSGAGELLPVVQLAMKLGAGYKEIANLVIVHPTLCEGLTSLFAAVPPKAV